MTSDYFCHCGQKMVPVWTDATDEAELCAMFCEECGSWERPRDEDLNRVRGSDNERQ